MNRIFRHLPIKAKLFSMLFFSTILSLIIAMLLLAIVEIAQMKNEIRSDLEAMGRLVADRSTAALVFDDVEVALESLQALSDLSHVTDVCMYKQQGEKFTSKHKLLKKQCPARMDGLLTQFQKNQLFVFVPVWLDDEQVGGLLIIADLSQKLERKLKYIGLVLLVFFSASMIAFFLTAPILNWVSSPLKKLADIAHKISTDKNYALRAKKNSNDEIGVLVDAFNNMLTTVDIQNRKLETAINNYLALYDNNPSMVFHLNLKGRILSVNRFGARQLGLTVNQIVDKSIFDFVHPDDRGASRALFDLCLLNPTKVYKEEVRKICFDDRIIWVRESARVLEEDDERRNFLLVCEDVTEAKMLSEKVAYQASHDALTGLVNRREFDIHVQQIVEEAQINHSVHALGYLDLDQFKVINDTCGHLAGDELLRQLGDELKKNMRHQDVLARLGGDEFGVLMLNCSVDEALHVSEKLRSIVCDFQFGWEDRCFNVGVSIGVALINHVCGNAVDILKEADAACYAANDKGRNRVHLFSPDDEELASRQGEMQWVEKIQRGIEEDKFCLYGQTIISVDDGNEEIIFETLVRYKNEQGGIVGPGAFLPAAERYNIISALDKQVIAKLFQWLSEHPQFLNELAHCSLNLSGLTLTDESMLGFIDQQFAYWKIPTEKICFEITETAAISNLTFAQQFIHSLRQRGCSISLDDFGSGLSSFAYLKNLPVDYLKIDGQFVKDILDDKVDHAMVESINSVGHVMGKKTIAEFVENDEILAKLKSLGVDYAQGYGIAAPKPLDELL